MIEWHRSGISRQRREERWRDCRTDIGIEPDICGVECAECQIAKESDEANRGCRRLKPPIVHASCTREAARVPGDLNGLHSLILLECKLLLILVSVAEPREDGLHAADCRDRHPAAAVHAAGPHSAGARGTALLRARSVGRLVREASPAPHNRRRADAVHCLSGLRRAGVFPSEPGHDGRRRASGWCAQARRVASPDAGHCAGRARKSATSCRCSSVG